MTNLSTTNHIHLLNSYSTISETVQKFQKYNLQTPDAKIFEPLAGCELLVRYTLGNAVAAILDSINHLFSDIENGVYVVNLRKDKPLSNDLLKAQNTFEQVKDSLGDFLHQSASDLNPKVTQTLSNFQQIDNVEDALAVGILSVCGAIGGICSWENPIERASEKAKQATKAVLAKQNEDRRWIHLKENAKAIKQLHTFFAK